MTIGEELKQTREIRKLTIKQVTQSIHIRANYLMAMESDNFSVLPSDVQARGFLRIYADFLKLDSEDLINRLKGSPAKEIAPRQVLDINEIQKEGQLSEHLPEISNQIKSENNQVNNISFDDTSFISEQSITPTAFQKIFNEIGNALRNRRELISLTLEEVERHTHIRKHNLELIETGDFDSLPSPVQLRGTLSTYANFLDLDTDALLLRYADAIQARRIEILNLQNLKPSHRKGNKYQLPYWFRRFISPDLIFGTGMIAILLALSVWGAQRIMSDQALRSATQGPSISDVLLEANALKPTQLENIPTVVLREGTPIPTIDEALITPTDTIEPTLASAVQVTVVILERTYLKVTVDGKVVQDGRVLTGAALTFDGNSLIEVLTGSGKATQIIFNGADLGAMGDLGEVVDRIYTINGVETPTPTQSPTPTITPKPSPTSRPTATLRPTLTLRPTATPPATATGRP